MTPAEELRAAASLLREMAANATPVSHTDGRWTAHAGGTVTGDYTVAYRCLMQGDAEWIALAGPQIAEPLAAWLEFVAETWAVQKRGVRSHALAVARAILRNDVKRGAK